MLVKGVVVPQNYTFDTPIGFERVRRIKRLFDDGGNEKNLEMLEWQYDLPPEGPAITTFSVSGLGDDAAVYSVFPLKFTVSGSRDMLGAQSLDTLTDSNHRGKGLFVESARKNYSEAKSKGVGFVYGFPNSFSGPGFFKKLGWRDLGFPPFRIFLWNLLYPLKKMFGVNVFFPNILIAVFSFLRVQRYLRSTDIRFVFDVDFKSDGYRCLWANFSQSLPLSLSRSSEYMEWRYKSKPKENYQYLAAYCNDKLVGICVFVLKEKHGGNIGYIMDLIYDATHGEVGNALLAKATLTLCRCRADVILAWADDKHSVNAPYLRVGYFSIPRRLQPIKLHFGVVSLGVDADALDIENMYLSYADSDTV